MTDFNGTAGVDIANANTLQLAGFTTGSLAELVDNEGDQFLCGAGDDIVFAGPAGFRLVGGEGADELHGSGEDDVFNFRPGDVVAGEILDGGGGTDTLLVESAGGNVDFSVATVTSFEALVFLTGNLFTASFSASQFGGTGVSNSLAISVNPTAGAQHRVVISMGAVSALNLSGFTFDATWTAGSGTVRVTGDGSSETIVGSNARDLLIGNGGNDVLIGGTGADTLAGGTGDDRYYVDAAAEIIDEVPGQGSDVVFTSVSYTLAALQEIELFATAAQGGTDPMTLTGNNFGQRINGNNGNNIIYGGSGDDLLIGYGGNDNIEGQAGADTLTGGSGADKFVFRYSTIATAGAYHISDFGADDAIFVDHPSVTGPLNPAAFVTGANALDANDRFIYYAPFDALYFDQDGVGGAAKVLMAVFDNGYVPTAVDIVLF